MKLEELVIVEYIRFDSFKEKISITMEFDGKAKLQIYKNYVLVERKEYAR